MKRFVTVLCIIGILAGGGGILLEKECRSAIVKPYWWVTEVKTTVMETDRSYSYVNYGLTYCEPEHYGQMRAFCAEYKIAPPSVVLIYGEVTNGVKFEGWQEVFRSRYARQEDSDFLWRFVTKTSISSITQDIPETFPDEFVLVEYIPHFRVVRLFAKTFITEDEDKKPFIRAAARFSKLEWPVFPERETLIDGDW